MKIYNGNLIIEKNDQRDFSKLEEVTGDLYINSQVKLDALTTVGGDLYINSQAKLDAPALTTVGGNLYINSQVKLDALTTVGGYLYIKKDVKFNTSSLKKLKWKSIDGYLFVIESEKSTKGIKVLSGYNAKGMVKGILGKDKCYVASKGKMYSHGKTVKKAIQDLQFKILSEKLKKSPIKADTIIDINYYRLITGSCEMGVNGFIQENKLKSKYKAKDLLPILEKHNAYGLDKFKSLITF